MTLFKTNRDESYISILEIAFCVLPISLATKICVYFGSLDFNSNLISLSRFAINFCSSLPGIFFKRSFFFSSPIFGIVLIFTLLSSCNNTDNYKGTKSPINESSDNFNYKIPLKSKDEGLERSPQRSQKSDSLLVLYFKSCGSFPEIKKGVFFLRENDTVWKSIPSIFPVEPDKVKKISSLSGVRFHPIDFQYKRHNGIDFAGKRGSYIYATLSGVVTRSIYTSGFGNHIVIKNYLGFTTKYAHLNRRLVNKGDTIKQGQLIGLMGTTGKSTGVHLHYEVHKNGKILKPLDFCLLRVPQKKEE